jgi:hypothetical protein
MSKRKKLLVALVGVAVLVLGGIAYALWNATGEGTGRATARTAIDIDVVARSGAADLYPGFTEGDIFFTLDNDNPYPVNFDEFTVNEITSSDPTNCPASLLDVDDSVAIDIDLAASTVSPVDSEIADVVTLSSAAGDACQGVEFTIDLTLSGSQV